MQAVSMHVTSISDGEKPSAQMSSNASVSARRPRVVAAVLLRHEAAEQAEVRELLPTARS